VSSTLVTASCAASCGAIRGGDGSAVDTVGRARQDQRVIRTLAVEGYRSLRAVVLPLEQVNVVTGANGSGKSSLYRSLRLLADAAREGVVSSLAREGGLPSTLWAGPAVISRAMRAGEHRVEPLRSAEPVALRLGFASDAFGYAVDLGYPPQVPESMFHLDPEIKSETIWAGPVARPAATLVTRRGAVVQIRQDDGSWLAHKGGLSPFDSMLSEVADPEAAPEVLRLREQIRSWRFYDHFPTDAGAPARSAQVGTRRPVLSQDGSDLASALQTIVEIGDGDGLLAAVERGFPGSRLEITSVAGRFQLALHQPGMLRPLGAAELSDGTLRYLLLVAALLSPRPPGLLVLNEPETSLHPDLLPALAELVVRGADRTQVVVVSHSGLLTDRLDDAARRHDTRLHRIELVKDLGETTVRGQEGLLDVPRWAWPQRR
jgi:predicted ATPase